MVFDFQTAILRPDEIERTRASHVQFHQGCQINCFLRDEIPDRQFFVEFNRVQNFLRLAGLAASQISRFQSASVVFAFRLAALVSGLGVRRPRGLFQNGKAFA